MLPAPVEVVVAEFKEPVEVVVVGVVQAVRLTPPVLVVLEIVAEPQHHLQ
jgi:hypothetical protein